VQFAIRRGGKVISWGTNKICPRTKLIVLVNPSPFQLVEMMPMQRVDLIFRMLKLNNAYVTRCGKLVGVISRNRMIQFLGTTSKYREPGVFSTASQVLCELCGSLFSYHSQEHSEYEKHGNVSNSYFCCCKKKFQHKSSLNESQMLVGK